MRKKFSRKMKTEFTQQWVNEIPSMGIYKNMWLMNIIGPVVVGVLLEVKSGNDMYYPTVHLDNLADYIDEDPSLVAPITDGFENISSISPPDKYLKILNNLKEKTLIPFEGDVHIDLIINNLVTYASQEFYEADIKNILEILISLAFWSEKQLLIEEVKRFVDKRSKYLLKHEIWFQNEKERNEWCIDLYKRNENKSKIDEQIEKNIIALKMEHLPRRKVIID